MLTKAQARQHHTDAETRYKNVDTNHTLTLHDPYYMAMVDGNDPLKQRRKVVTVAD